MNSSEIKLLSKNASNDGQKLIEACDKFQKISDILVKVIAVLGVIAALVNIIMIPFALAIGIFTFFTCFILKFGTIFTINVARMIVHSTLANVAQLERTVDSNHVERQTQAPQAPEQHINATKVQSAEHSYPSETLNKNKTEKVKIQRYEETGDKTNQVVLIGVLLIIAVVLLYSLTH
jgi:cell division septation protein DedD